MSEENEIKNESEESEIVEENLLNETNESVDPLEEALKDRDNYKSIAQRAQADLVNYRTRASQELEETRRNLKITIFHRVISVADDLSRAVESIPEDSDAQWSDGVKLVLRNFENFLDIEGVKKIESLGKEFDPNFHEALMYEDDETSEDGTIISIIASLVKISTAFPYSGLDLPVIIPLFSLNCLLTSLTILVAVFPTAVIPIDAKR